MYLLCSFKQKRKIQSIIQQFKCDLLLQVGGLGLQTPIVVFSTMQEMEALPNIEKPGLHL